MPSPGLRAFHLSLLESSQPWVVSTELPKEAQSSAVPAQEAEQGFEPGQPAPETTAPILRLGCTLTTSPSAGWAAVVPACMLSRFSHVQLFATLWTSACQAPLSIRACTHYTLTRGVQPERNHPSKSNSEIKVPLGT